MASAVHSMNPLATCVVGAREPHVPPEKGGRPARSRSVGPGSEDEWNRRTRVAAM